MKKRFSEVELRKLRSEIDLEHLLTKALLLPLKREQGELRFSCPKCGNQQAVLLGKTNLARCPQCARNFNAIDLVLHHFRCSFSESVYLLQAWCQQSPKNLASNIPSFTRPERRIFRASR